jgi:fatty-acyl-CoA synthase
MGHNYYPEDFEWAAGRIEGVRAGRCVAFTDPATERVILLVEPSVAGDADVLRRDVRRGVADTVGVAPAEVLVLSPGTIEKTTSGKLRRTAMRDAYAGGALATA